MKRAKAGQGEQTLKGRARVMARRKGHDLGNFVTTEPYGFGWRARCKVCLRMVVILPRQWEIDGNGIGGTATELRCDNRKGKVIR